MKAIERYGSTFTGTIMKRGDGGYVEYSDHIKQRAKDKQEVIKAIDKRIKMAKKIIEINNMKLESCKDKDLETEIIANLNVINDYEIFLVAIDEIYKEVSIVMKVKKLIDFRRQG